MVGTKGGRISVAITAQRHIYPRDWLGSGGNTYTRLAMSELNIFHIEWL
jgi:hypothetical protein